MKIVIPVKIDIYTDINEQIFMRYIMEKLGFKEKHVWNKAL